MLYRRRALAKMSRWAGRSGARSINGVLSRNYPRAVQYCIKRTTKKVATDLHILQAVTTAVFIRFCLSEAQ